MSRYPFPATPDGWYGVARADEVAAREVVALRCFGRDLVCFRGEDGAARGEKPGYEIARLREDESSWTPWRTSAYRVRVHLQDLTENILDRQHFANVHDMAPPEPDHSAVRFDGPRLVVEQKLTVTAVSSEGVQVLSRTTTPAPASRSPRRGRARCT